MIQSLIDSGQLKADPITY